MTSRLVDGDGGIRTLDLSDANRTLSQLSYTPLAEYIIHRFGFGCKCFLKSHVTIHGKSGIRFWLFVLATRS